MIRSLLDIIVRRSEFRQRIERIVFAEPLHRFEAAEDLGYFILFKSLAKSLAKQTHDFVVSLLCDDSISDWATVAREATPQQFMNVATFCSHCLVQFGLKEVRAQASKPVTVALGADVSDLARVMYGDFAPKREPGALTFDDSLQLRNLDDPVEVRDLTRWVDQLLGIEEIANSNRELKIRKLSGLLAAHVQAFAYRLHGFV